MSKYNVTIKSEGFTPTRCHYYVIEMIKHYEEIEGLVSMIKPYTKVIFQSNPIHAYIANCIKTNMPIVIKAELVVITTPFQYNPHVVKNGIEEPLLASHYDLETNKYQRRKVIMDKVITILCEHELKNKDKIMSTLIKKLSKWKV